MLFAHRVSRVQSARRLTATAGVLAALAASCLVSCASATTQRQGQAITEERRDELRISLIDVLKQLDLYGMPPDWEEKANETVVVGRHMGYTRDTYRYTIRCQMGHEADDIQFDMDPEDSGVYFLYNRIAAAKAAEDAKKTAEPSLTKKQVEARARAYIAVFRGSMPDDLSKPGVRYRSEDGEWGVVYCRRVSGYACMGETLSVRFSEKYGLLSFSDKRHTQVKSFEITVTEDEAVAIAAEHVRALAEKTPLLRGLTPVARKKMAILSPYVYEWPDPRVPIDVDVLHTGHLVHLVQMVDKGKPDLDVRDLPRVFVDAQTGEVVAMFPPIRLDSEHRRTTSSTGKAGGADE